MASINTNRSALQALQAAQGSNRELSGIQRRLATGLKVAGTVDDSAAFTIAESIRSDSLVWQSTAKGLARVRSMLDVGTAGAEQIGELMVQLREKGTRLIDADASDGKALRADIAALISQVDQIARTAEYQGVNLLIGQPVIETVSTHSYGGNWTSLPQSGFQVPMHALPPETAMTRTAQVRHVLPASPLTPPDYAAVRDSLNGSGSRVVPIAGGTTAGRFNLLLEQSGSADSVEIWQDGVRVAATGRGYAADGAAVGAASAVNGPHVLSFDYDPARGEDLEIRVTNGGGNFWQVSGLELQDPAEPVPDPIQLRAQSAYLTTSAVFDPLIGTANPEQVARAIDDKPDFDGMPQGIAQTVTVPGGSVAGRVDVSFDAFESPDTLEIWQDGVRIAATGQGYAAGGAAVGPASAVSGAQMVSFDYDPAKGALTFKFNENGAAPDSAWVVGDMTLYPAGGSPGAVSRGASSYTRDSYGPIRHDFNIAPDLSFQRIRTRDLTAAGLGLDGLDNADPEHLLRGILDAEGRVSKALSYLGNKYRTFSTLQEHAETMVDIRDVAVGQLVDADMAKEAAALEAAQVKEQLAIQAMAIANNSPRFMLDLFR